ncbi:hypothetical protein M407DRAFT_34497 [Tulasnella calospora MUT 4182]|uniref:Tetratricopeptide repeat protein 29 n=1 Tax=Tulasnella calospora MUT 4182 TaxID=1051891 RepID=A0A0C3Q0J2_9AGAM|nr:hypothetical protein M407DRAFT_34525 [Tulasnella calospora MUT 4182]KIO15889.1 hypothetical protein M407DRAFT_34497 [Tulasnella calospora MUT 4182]
MTGNLPYGETSADYAIIRKIFESPLPQVDGASRLSDCLQLWDLTMRCWNVEPQERPTARMCKTTVTYLPRCTPTPANPDHQTRSAALLENLGDLESWKGNPEKSSAYLNEALRLYQEDADTKGIARVLQKQAAAAYRYSDFDKAIATATAALEHFRNLDDPLGIAGASYTLGDSLALRGQVDEALRVLQEALEINRTHGNDVGAALCLERIGALQRITDQLDEALFTVEEAVAVASQSGDRFAVARALRTMGLVHLDRSNSDRAAEAFLMVRPIAQNIGWYAGLSDIEQRMGCIKMQSGDYHEAEALFQNSVSIARQARARWELAWNLRRLGECFQQQSKVDEAASALREACLLFQELSLANESVQVASTLVELKRSQGDWDGTLFWYDHIITVYRSQGGHGTVAYYLAEKGDILVKAQRYDEAALHFEATIVTFAENGYSLDWELERLCAVPKTAMKWERRLPLLCNLKKLQRRQPQLTTATLKFPIPLNSGEP